MLIESFDFFIITENIYMVFKKESIGNCKKKIISKFW